MSFDRTLDESALFRICFVCTGNICRSPMAEVVFRDLVKLAGFEGKVTVISAGTGDWHVGERSDERTLNALATRGYDGSCHRAKQSNTEEDRSKVRLLLGFDADQAEQVDVPDPYYSDTAMFDMVLGMIEKASASLFRQIEPGIRRVAS